MIQIDKKNLLMIIILLSFTPIYAQNFLDLVKIGSFPDQMYGGGVYTSRYILRNNLGKEIPLLLTFNITDNLPIMGPEFNLSIQFRGETNKCLQIEPSSFECLGSPIPSNSENELKLILYINHVTAPSNYTFAFGVLGEVIEHPPAKIEVLHRELSFDGINNYDYRTSQYIFMGEQLSLNVRVTNYNGVEDIGFVKVLVDGRDEALCSPTGESGETWKIFECLLTAEPSWYGEREIMIRGWNNQFIPFDSFHAENWFFNPALSMSMTTSDGKGISFEPLPEGADTPEERIVHSTNRIRMKNTAEGGVNMWMYLSGTDLTDLSGTSKCPDTNRIEIEKYMWYRGWSGTQWESWEGWNQMGKYDQNEECRSINSGPLTSLVCYGGKPVPFDENVEETWQSHLLTNQGTAEVEFKLEYPIPCVGNFDQGSLMVFGKAV